MLLAVVFALSLLAVTGCDQVQHGANDAGYVAGNPTTNPATQPAEHDALETGRAVVQAVALVYPPVKTIATMVGLIAGAAGVLAGHFNGKSTERKQNGGVIVEIVDDIAAFKQKDVPWTAATAKLLEDLGLQTP
jgi:hypothetical protein